jgi:hypothetical protein
MIMKQGTAGFPLDKKKIVNCVLPNGVDPNKRMKSIIAIATSLHVCVCIGRRQSFVKTANGTEKCNYHLEKDSKLAVLLWRFGSVHRNFEFSCHSLALSCGFTTVLYGDHCSENNISFFTVTTDYEWQCIDDDDIM